MKSIRSNRGKGLVRAEVRRGTRTGKAQTVTRQAPPREPTICRSCGATFLRRAWRRRPLLDHEVVERAEWGTCPACGEAGRGEYAGRVVAPNAGAAEARDAIGRRIANVARRAGFTQPECRIVSIEWTGGALEVLTSSQQLAHRVANELRKAFGGRVAYAWSSDGSLIATWHAVAPKVTTKKVAVAKRKTGRS